MIVMTITARYRDAPDEVFADTLSFDALNRDLGGLVDYHGLPRGNVSEGQTYSFTPVLWTWFRLEETHVTCTRIDRAALECESIATQGTDQHDQTTSRYLTRITPDGDGSLWFDRVEMTGQPPSRFALAIGRYIQKAGHRRRRARNIRVVMEHT